MLTLTVDCVSALSRMILLAFVQGDEEENCSTLTGAFDRKRRKSSDSNAPTVITQMKEHLWTGLSTLLGIIVFGLAQPSQECGVRQVCFGEVAVAIYM